MDSSLQPLYLLFDVSGSTVRSGFNDACSRALPLLIDELEGRDAIHFRLGVLTFASTAEVALGLVDLSALQFLPSLRPGGFSLLASGLRLLGSTIAADFAQLHADGFDVNPALVVLLTDGLAMDPSEELDRAVVALQRDCAEGLLGSMLLSLSPEESMPTATLSALLGAGFRVDVIDLPNADGSVLARTVLDRLGIN